MDTAIVVAVIALVASVVSATGSLFGDVLLATWKSRREVRSALTTYRATLAGAAYELQARLFNIVNLSFLQAYYVRGEETEKEYAVQNTLYVIAQYFAWVEALRREVERSRFAEFRRHVTRRLDEVGRLFGSDSLLARALIDLFGAR